MRSQKTRLEKLERGSSEGKHAKLTHYQQFLIVEALTTGKWERLLEEFSAETIEQLREIFEDDQDEQNAHNKK